MTLNKHEQEIWDLCEQDLTTRPRLDRIERAALDMRIVTAMKSIICNGAELNTDFHEVCAQIAFDYILDPDEVMTSIELAEDRILRGET